MKLDDLLTAWRGGLIVSCQAPPDSPLARPEMIAALALTAERNGAVGLRLDGPANIRAVLEEVSVPILGIEKIVSADSDVYITPTFASAARVLTSGAHLVALDATARPRPGGETFREIVARLRTEFGRPAMADVATYDEGLRAVETDGADLVSTTLSGYTPETRGSEEPDFALVERLAKRLRVPVLCEGRLRSPAHVRRAFDCGAFAVVVGNSITGVDWLTRQYAAATPRSK